MVPLTQSSITGGKTVVCQHFALVSIEQGCRGEHKGEGHHISCLLQQAAKSLGALKASLPVLSISRSTTFSFQCEQGW